LFFGLSNARGKTGGRRRLMLQPVMPNRMQWLRLAERDLRCDQFFMIAIAFNSNAPPLLDDRND